MEEYRHNAKRSAGLLRRHILWPWDKPDVQWAWDRADDIITKFNRMKRDVQADDVDLLKMIAEALVEAKGK